MRLVFLGTHAPRLDDKGRLVLPAKFREALAPGLVLTKGQDRSIVVWPAAEFTAYAARLGEASRSDERARAYLRVLFSSAFDEQPDKQGRVTLGSTATSSSLATGKPLRSGTRPHGPRTSRATRTRIHRSTRRSFPASCDAVAR